MHNKLHLPDVPSQLRKARARRHGWRALLITATGVSLCVAALTIDSGLSPNDHAEWLMVLGYAVQAVSLIPWLAFIWHNVDDPMEDLVQISPESLRLLRDFLVQRYGPRTADLCLQGSPWYSELPKLLLGLPGRMPVARAVDGHRSLNGARPAGDARASASDASGHTSSATSSCSSSSDGGSCGGGG